LFEFPDANEFHFLDLLALDVTTKVRTFQPPFSQATPFSQLLGVKIRTRLALSKLEGIGLGRWREIGWS
jgi:hypothetical protein